MLQGSTLGKGSRGWIHGGGGRYHMFLEAVGVDCDVVYHWVTLGGGPTYGHMRPKQFLVLFAYPVAVLSGHSVKFETETESNFCGSLILDSCPSPISCKH